MTDKIVSAALFTGAAYMKKTVSAVIWYFAVVLQRMDSSILLQQPLKYTKRRDLYGKKRHSKRMG